MVTDSDKVITLSVSLQQPVVTDNTNRQEVEAKPLARIGRKAANDA